MVFKSKDKEYWNREFVIFPVKTIEGQIVLLQHVYVRHRFIGYDPLGYGDEFVVEYSLKDDNERN